jgi:hypothetical protein
VRSASGLRSPIATAWRASRLSSVDLPAGTAACLRSTSPPWAMTCNSARASIAELRPELGWPAAIRWSVSDRDRSPVQARNAASVFRGGLDFAPRLAVGLRREGSRLGPPSPPHPAGRVGRQARYAGRREAGRAEHVRRGSAPAPDGESHFAFLLSFGSAATSLSMAESNVSSPGNPNHLWRMIPRWSTT